MRVLDACAAPGGKTTHLLEVAGGPLDLVALDISAERLALVGSNLRRLGLEATLLAGDATCRNTDISSSPLAETMSSGRSQGSPHDVPSAATRVRPSSVRENTALPSSGVALTRPSRARRLSIG